MSHNSTRGDTLLRDFANNSSPSEVLRQQAGNFLANKDLPQKVLGLVPDDQKKFVDKVDRAYRILDSQSAKHIIALGNLCSAIQRLPTSAELSTGLEKRGNIAVASGGFTDIWRGDFGGKRVAIKAFRIYPAQNLKEAKEILWKRVPVWRRLSHQNILPFQGVNMTLFQLALVYDWGHHGNITQYIASNPQASRLSLLLDVAMGLQYLHGLDIPHGDVKGANVIINERRRACLTEFGLAPINSDPNFTVAATPGSVGTSRWLAPEIITPTRKGTPMPVMESKPADVFAYGMFSMEVFTGKIPFEEQKNEAVVLRISQGIRPEMPANAQAVGLNAEMWGILEHCWQQNPKRRPTMEEVVRRWKKFAGNDDGLMAFPGDLQSTEDRGEGPSRRRVKTEAPHFRPQSDRLRTTSEVVRTREKPRNTRARHISTSGRQETRFGDIPQSPISDITPQIPQPEATPQPPRIDTTRQPMQLQEPHTPKGGGACCCVIM